jgi:uncharacterized repeat protein (TIGR03837 family)
VNAPLRSWDIFCHVVDNFGDVGVCWRLARQLAHEQGCAVRLWVDQPASLARIVAGFDATRASQTVQDVQVRAWTLATRSVEVADVVVEAFGCELPPAYIAAMAARPTKPAWINLEYLSAESWVEGSHARPSPHPRLPLVKHFFFPGFTGATGGLLRERDLLQRREEFQDDLRAQAQLWQEFGLPMPRAGELRASLFCYDNPAIPALLDAWAGGDEPLACLVPATHAAQGVLQHLGAASTVASTQVRRGNLLVCIFPLVDQDRYDRLLWACDFNFVRGEDSFVRAQWAGRPFVWHIYPQHDGAHWKKLDAFLDRYTEGLDPGAAAGLRAFWRAWNRGDGAPWPLLRGQRSLLLAHAQRWAAQLSGTQDLATQLAQFASNVLKL